MKVGALEHKRCASPLVSENVLQVRERRGEIGNQFIEFVIVTGSAHVGNQVSGVKRVSATMSLMMAERL